jgi:hypothetical protein
MVNYTERHRAGLRVGTAMTEGTANFLVNRRMDKSQSMRWSRRGADLLLQVRCSSAPSSLRHLQRHARLWLRPEIPSSQQSTPASGDCGLTTPNLRRPRTNAICERLTNAAAWLGKRPAATICGPKSRRRLAATSARSAMPFARGLSRARRPRLPSPWLP